MADILSCKIRSVDIRQEGTRVLVLDEGRVILNLPWQAADELAHALTFMARRAEEQDKALQVVEDQAILLRSGFPIALTGRGDIMREARKEAAWSSKLRRAIRGIRSSEKFGVPRVIKEPRDEDHR